MSKKQDINSPSFSKKDNAVTNIAVKNKSQKELSCNPQNGVKQQKDCDIMNTEEENDSVQLSSDSRNENKQQKEGDVMNKEEENYSVQLSSDPQNEDKQKKDCDVVDKVLEDNDSVKNLVAEKPVGEDCDVLNPPTRRLLWERMSLVKDPPAGVELLREEKGLDMLNCSPLWRVRLQGASRELGEYQFMLQFHFPTSYPLEPPEVTILGDSLPESELITRRGRVLLPLLVSHWSPAESVRSVCTAFSSLLAEAGQSNSRKRDRPVEDDDNDEDKDQDMEEYVQEIRDFLAGTKLGLEPSMPPTEGDGNCWFRAVATQVEMADLVDMPRTHMGLRNSVADHVKSLPAETKDGIVENIFKGKMTSLMALVSRQRKDGQWVDDHGVMCLATADFLSRNIEIYGFQVEGSGRDFSLRTVEPSSEERKREADAMPAFTVFLSALHYTSLQRS